MCKFYLSGYQNLLGAAAPQGDHSNTSDVLMRDQRFSKHTLVAISLSRKSTPSMRILCNFASNLPLNKHFGGHFSGI